MLPRFIKNTAIGWGAFRLIAMLDGEIAMSGEKHFTQVVTQEKSRDEDYRSFLTCRASDGTRWELRGYGKTVVEATADAWANFKCSEDEWDLHGYSID